MKKEGVEVSITGNSTNPTRFQHLVAGTYKKWAMENGKKYFSVASGGGTGRTLHPDNVAAGPASYGLTDSMGRMHGDAQFAGSSSVPAHVEMMGLIGMGNNPMVDVYKRQVGNFARQEQLGIGRNGLVDHGVNIFGYILAAQYLAALAVDDLALAVHHVVELQHVFADGEVAGLQLFLGVLDGAGDHLVLNGHVFLDA